MSRLAPREAVFRQEGEYWTITYQSLTFRLRDTIGLGYLARLFREPDRELHALVLAGTRRGGVATGPPPRAADGAQLEIDALTEHLAAAVGLGGRDRMAAAQAERARVNVTKAIRAGIRRIARYDARLGEHLRHSVRTGAFCSYAPDPAAKITWIL